MTKRTPEILSKTFCMQTNFRPVHISVKRKNLANSCSRISFQMMLLISLLNPLSEFRRVSKVWMVCMVWLRFGHLCPPEHFFAKK